MSPKVVDKAKKRQQIYEAAIALFSKKGVWNTTISQIAKEAGVGKGTIYEYFGSKEDILMAALKATIERVAEIFHDEFEKEDNPIEKILTYPKSIWRYFLEESRESIFLIVIYQLEAFFFSDEKFVSMRQEVLDLKMKTGLPIMEKMFNAIDEGKQKGLIRKDIDNVDIFMIIAYQAFGLLLHGIADFRSVDKLQNTFKDILLKGITPQEGGPQ